MTDISKRPFVLLPQDRVIMEITGMDRKQYREFCIQCYKASRTIPTDQPVAFEPLTFIVTLVIGAALSYAASLLTPKPKVEEPKQQRDEGGQRFVNGERSAPTSSFNSVQNVVEVGSVIPLIYANRRQVSGRFYGGVRVNTNLLWSQMYSIGGGQLLRGLFSVGEGSLPEPDPEQYAIGNNIIRNFDLAINDSARVSLYYVNGSETSNRITSSDHIAGRSPGSDLGNAQTDGGSDVFQTRRTTGWASDFVSVVVPSNQTVFGLSGFIGNNMPFRPNPRIKPTRNYDAEPSREDPQGKSDRAKDIWKYYGRAGVRLYNGNASGTTLRSVSVGDTIGYTIYSSSDNDGEFQYQISGADGYTYCNDVANSVASRQKNYDDQIVIGDKYLIGTAQGICISRTNQPFESEVDNTPVGGGVNVTATFRITSAGQIHTYSTLNPGRSSISEDDFVGNRYPEYAPDINASNRTHIYRLAEASFTTERKTRFVEFGIRSQVNLQFNGLCYFKGIAKQDDTRTFTEIDSDKQDDNISFTNSTYTSPETRYSGFRVKYRETSASSYTTIPRIFLVRSQQSTSVYNYLRLEFSTAATYEIQLTPVNAYEIRNSSNQINILDYKRNNRIREGSGISGVTVAYTGNSNFARNGNNFAVAALTTIEGNRITDNSGPDLEFDDDISGRDYFADAFARASEAFVFEEIQSSANQPEHEITYVNIQTANNTEPRYDNIAMVGMNIRSSREIQSLQQFSVYCEDGIGSTNLFPEVLLDMLTNDRYGIGKILNSSQIDTASFTAMAAWCNSRKYFFDGIIDEKINIRSWGTETARNYLLDLIVRNGKFALQPIVDFDDAPVITALFTAGNIIDETFEFSSAEEQDLIAPRISVKWREEKLDASNGLFPVVRQVTVREATTSSTAPLETIDISDYATSQEHAIDLAKLTCRQRRLITHSISFETTPTEAALDIGSVFKLGMESVTFNQPQNGAIAADGTVTAWPPIENGTYDVLLWDGVTNTVQETTIIITQGKANASSAVFCLRSGTTTAETYKTQVLNYTEDGNINVEANVYPTDANGNSLLTAGFDDAVNWVIEGNIY